MTSESANAYTNTNTTDLVISCNDKDLFCLFFHSEFGSFDSTCAAPDDNDAFPLDFLGTKRVEFTRMQDATLELVLVGERHGSRLAARADSDDDGVKDAVFTVVDNPTAMAAFLGIR